MSNETESIQVDNRDFDREQMVKELYEIGFNAHAIRVGIGLLAVYACALGVSHESGYAISVQHEETVGGFLAACAEIVDMFRRQPQKLKVCTRRVIPDIVEQMAEILYRNDNGMNDAKYEESQGGPRRAWKTSAPWDSQPDVELCEWDRDKYRLQAEAVFKAMKVEPREPEDE